MREFLRKLYWEGIKSVDPYKILKRNLSYEGNNLRFYNKFYDLTKYEKIVVIGAGKASLKMALAIEEIFRDKINEGFIAIKGKSQKKLEKIKYLSCGHPIPNNNSLIAGKTIFDILKKSDERTLVISLISGGASALMIYPLDLGKNKVKFELSEIRNINKKLMKSGANINEINVIRKNISMLKGGNLAKVAYPASVINSIVSDVVGDDPAVIGSAPFVRDSENRENVKKISKKYGIDSQKIDKLADFDNTSPINNDDKYFAKIETKIVAKNLQMLQRISLIAKNAGLRPYIITSHLTGEAREVAKMIASITFDVIKETSFVEKPACLILGGETTVTVKGSGKGGRNQELALAFLREFLPYPEHLERVSFLSAASDGNDGPTDAAGAFVDSATRLEADKKGINVAKYLENNDSYNFFTQTNSLFKTGLTYTNVNDLQIVIVK